MAADELTEEVERTGEGLATVIVRYRGVEMATAQAFSLSDARVRAWREARDAVARRELDAALCAAYGAAADARDSWSHTDEWAS